MFFYFHHKKMIIANCNKASIVKLITILCINFFSTILLQRSNSNEEIEVYIVFYQCRINYNPYIPK